MAEAEGTRSENEEAKEPEVGGGGLLGGLGSARRAVSRSFERISGTEFRIQFEEFTNAVTIAVVGVHRDQQELRDRIEELERSMQKEPPPTPIPRLVYWSFGLSVVAVALSVVAVLGSL